MVFFTIQWKIQIGSQQLQCFDDAACNASNVNRNVSCSVMFLEAIFRDCRICNPLHHFSKDQLALGSTLHHDVASSHADIRLTNLNWSMTKTNSNCQQIGLHETENDKQNFVVFYL